MRIFASTPFFSIARYLHPEKHFTMVKVTFACTHPCALAGKLYHLESAYQDHIIKTAIAAAVLLPSRTTALEVPQGHCLSAMSNA